MLGTTPTGTLRVNNNWWDKNSAAAIAATIENAAPITINTSGFLSKAPVEIDPTLGNNPNQLQSISIEYYHADGFNSPNVATDATGAVLWQEHYQPFGESRLNQDPNPAINYTGHALDRDSGLVYAGARYLDPAIGRFMSMDPVEFTQDNPVSFNRYAYANNSPYMFADPDGESPVLLAALVAGAGYLLTANVANAPGPNDANQSNTIGDAVAPLVAAGGAVGALAVTKAIAKKLFGEVAKKTNPLNGTTYTDKVKRQMEGNDLDHNFSPLIDKQADAANVKKITGGDGIERTKVELPGSINGKNGNFSWIIEKDNTINHRQFERIRDK